MDTEVLKQLIDKLLDPIIVEQLWDLIFFNVILAFVGALLSVIGTYILFQFGRSSLNFLVVKFVENLGEGSPIIIEEVEYKIIGLHFSYMLLSSRKNPFPHDRRISLSKWRKMDKLLPLNGEEHEE